MRIRDSRTQFESMLRARMNPDDLVGGECMSTVLDVFRQFAAIPAEDAAPADQGGDGILVEFGTFRFRGRPEYGVSLMRQLVKASRSAPMWQLRCALFWDSTAETSLLGTEDLWSLGRDLDGYWQDVSSLPGLSWALQTSDAPNDLQVTFTKMA